MINNVQSFFESLGKYGCYFLTLVHFAEQKTRLNYTQDLYFLSCQFNRLGFMHFNKDNFLDKDNFYIKRPDLILNLLARGKYSVRKEPAEYIPQENETEILFYALSNKNAEKGIGHFRMRDFDTLQNSNTVKNGKVYSKRIIKEER